MKTFATFLHPGNWLANSETCSHVHWDIASERYSAMPGNNFDECWSQQNGKSLSGGLWTAGMNILWWIPRCNVSVRSMARQASHRYVKANLKRIPDILHDLQINSYQSVIRNCWQTVKTSSWLSFRTCIWKITLQNITQPPNGTNTCLLNHKTKDFTTKQSQYL